jgi:hypothetical protein
MDSELNDLYFEIEDAFSRINSRIYYIKNNKILYDLFIWFDYLKLDCNDLKFYTRALRDKFNESEIL